MWQENFGFRRISAKQFATCWSILLWWTERAGTTDTVDHLYNFNNFYAHHICRYGNLKRGVYDVKSNQWFQGFDWDGVFSKKAKAPYKPAVTSIEDTSNFQDVTDSDVIRRCSVNEYSYAFADFNVA